MDKQSVKREFLEAFDVVKRPGAQAVREFLQTSDFFEAPASTRYHGAYPGGLAEHSLNVYKRLLEIAQRDCKDPDGVGGFTVAEVAIMGLLHDVCKVGVYKPTAKRRKNPATGQWEDYKTYDFAEDLPLGHGEKSLYIITRMMKLTQHEAMAIRWHMGAYDDAVKGGSRAMTAAMETTPWVWRLQEADMCAAWIDERGTDNGTAESY